MVGALESQSKGSQFKTTRWLQGRLNLSSFRGPGSGLQLWDSLNLSTKEVVKFN